MFPSVWAFDDLEIPGGVVEVLVTEDQHKAMTAAHHAGVLKLKKNDLHPEGVESDKESMKKQQALEKEAFDPETGSQDVALMVARRDGTEDELLAYRAEQERITEMLLAGETLEGDGGRRGDKSPPEGEGEEGEDE